MSSNENAKENPKKMGKIKSCAFILIGFVLVSLIILFIIGTIAGDSSEEEQNTATEQQPQKDNLAKEQIEKDSLTIEQAKRDSLLGEVNLKYSYFFGRLTVAQDIVNRCEYSDNITNIKSLVEQGATVKASDTLLVTNALADLEETKKNMSAQMQEVRKLLPGEDLRRVEKAHNLDLKDINSRIKNCKEIKKILIKNLKEN